MKSVVERLEEYSVPVPEAGCRIWTKSVDGNGYGRLGAKKAHRAAWEAHKGPIPQGLSVLHHCDVPACVEPRHLFLGTQLDNVRDMMRKGRDRKAVGEASGMRKYPGLVSGARNGSVKHPETRPRGEANPKAKLTEALVREIRTSTEDARVIAIRVGVHYSTVYRVRRNEFWKDV